MTSLLTAGIGGWGLSFFLIPMSEEFGVSRTEFSAITLFRLAPLPFLPFLCYFVEKKHDKIKDEDQDWSIHQDQDQDLGNG